MTPSLHVGQGDHLTVERQNSQAGAEVFVGNETVKQAGVPGTLEGSENRPHVQRRNQPAVRRVEQAGTGICP